ILKPQNLDMKKALFVALFTLAGIKSQAQKMELGLNIGAMPHYSQSSDEVIAGMKPSLGVRSAWNTRGWQLGAGVDYFQAEAYDEVFAGTLRIDNYGLVLFGDKLFRLATSYFYAGINGGYISGASAMGGLTFIPHSGFNFGTQAGYTLNIIKGLGANVEAG